MRRCFRDVSLAPVDDTDPDVVEYKEYKEHKHGSMNPDPIFGCMDSEHEFGSLSMAAASLDGELIETRLENQNADLSDDEGASDSDSDSESDGDADA